MRKTCRLLGLVAVALMVPLLAGSAQDKKDPPAKGTRQLPANWSKLGLSDEQKSKVYSIQADFSPKIEALQKQIKALQKQERESLSEVLTDAQKARLKEILLEKVPGAKPEKTPPKADK